MTRIDEYLLDKFGDDFRDMPEAQKKVFRRTHSEIAKGIAWADSHPKAMKQCDCTEERNNELDFDSLKVGDRLTNTHIFSGTVQGYNYTIVSKDDDEIILEEECMHGTYPITREGLNSCLRLRLITEEGNEEAQ